MKTLEKLEAVYAMLAASVKLLRDTNYGLAADHADELLLELDLAVTGEQLPDPMPVTKTRAVA
jgi:hypothetical protein